MASPSNANPTSETDSVQHDDQQHFLHPFAEYPAFEKEGCLVIDRAEGAYIYDSDGGRYLDGIGGMWCVNIGYGHPEMVKAIAEQAERLAYYNCFTDTTNPPAAHLAAKLAELAPAPLNHVFYSSGGSTANDTAVRTIHCYFNRLGKPNKRKLITRHHAYHGSSYLTMTMGGQEDGPANFHVIPDLVEYVSAPYLYRRPEGTTVEEFCGQLENELEQKIQEVGPENVAAFFAEPIQGAGGVLVPPPGYHRRMQEVCRRYDVLYVMDEVVTAFGRLGHMMASESVFDVVPDLISFAKGITSGYAPLGATLISDAIHEVIRTPKAGADNSFGHGFTYSGHALCCAAALKNIEILEREEICEHVREIGPYFEKKLATLGDLPLVGDVRGSEFMLCVENVANKETKELLPEEVRISKRISTHCEQRGVMVRPVDHLNVLSPPLTLTREQVDTMVDVLAASIRATADDLVREGIWRG
jgi:putrescine aminotransferase